MTLPRTRLLERLFGPELRLVRLCAPPGYGKSSLARLFARRFDRHAICDCTGVCGTTEFAGRAMSALGRESQGGDSIAVARLRLHATEADGGTWSRALLDAWKNHHEHSLFILEHAEAIFENSDVLALLGDMLASRPPECIVLVSSRVALPLRYSHYLAPHQILTLSRHELRFDDNEAHSVFEGSDLAPEIVDRIVRLADGWPVVLLLLARFAQYDADIENLIDRLCEVAYEDLHEYLANEVLSAFTPDMMSTMLATASIPNASLDDISAATGIRHVTPIIDRLLHLPGFISSEAGVYQLHPLLHGALQARRGVEDAGYLFNAAHAYERSGDLLRAAELYALCNDEQAAAAALNRLPAALLQQPSSRLIEVLTKIAASVVRTYPNLWIAMLPYRRQHVESPKLFNEAERLLASMPPDAPPALRRRLRIRLAMLAQELDKLSEAQALMETGNPASSLDEWPEDRRLILMTSALIAAKQGRFANADRFSDESDAVQGARNMRFDAERAQIAIEKARLLGDWHGMLKMCEETLYAAQRSGLGSRIIGAARAVAQAAWFCNDDARVTAVNEMLENCGDGEVHLFAKCFEAALARSAIDAPGHVLHIARLHAALATTNIERARELFDQAIEGTDTFESAFLRIVIRVAAALLVPTERRRLLEARVIAQPLESPPLHASLELLIDSPEPGDYGIFKYLAARVACSPLKAHRDALYIDVVRGQIRRGAEVLHVSDRGLELLVALALLPAGTPKEELAAAIWTELDGEAALNALKMCVSRTRVQLADKEAICSTRRGYSLSERATIDVREFERLLRGLRGAQALGELLRRQVGDVVRALADRERGFTAGWGWFAPQNAHLDELAHSLALVLADDPARQHAAAVPEQRVATAASVRS